MAESAELQDARFREAVAAIDAGDLSALDRLLRAQPRLAVERLEAPGAWLRDRVGQALDGFFQRPYLLWFVAEDPVRNGRLPRTIAQVARRILLAAQTAGAGAEGMQEQLDYALTLVSWSWIARECGVQLALIDVLVDAGAAPGGNPNNALVNHNHEAAAHLLERGAPLSLGAALCLGRWDAVPRLAAEATPAQRQFGFVLAALNGHAEAVRRMLALGADLHAPSLDLYSHATAVHHAVCSGSLETVQVLVEAGADLSRQDTAWRGTPLGWAEHYMGQHRGDGRGAAFAEIGAYLRERGG